VVSEAKTGTDLRPEPGTRPDSTLMDTALLAVSHGTADPHGQARIRALAQAVRKLLDAEVLLSHVDVQSPRVGEVVASLPGDRPAVVVPLLLSAGYHVKVDLAEAAGNHPVAGALGPDGRLVDVLVRRALEAGFVRGRHRVVLGAAGSTDAGAVADCREVARRLAARLGTPVAEAYLSAARPTVAEAVAAARRDDLPDDPPSPVLVVSYLLAPGYFQRLLEAEAAGAGAAATTAPVLGGADGGVEPPAEVVGIVVDRFREAAGRAGLGRPTTGCPTAAGR
jgi:sirohydrochlorin ferrochelatase